MSIEDGRAVSNFIVSALKVRQSKYMVTEALLDHFVMSDTIDALIKLASSENTGPINIGNPTELYRAISKKNNSLD